MSDIKQLPYTNKRVNTVIKILVWGVILGGGIWAAGQTAPNLTEALRNLTDLANQGWKFFLYGGSLALAVYLAFFNEKVRKIRKFIFNGICARITKTIAAAFPVFTLHGFAANFRDLTEDVDTKTTALGGRIKKLEELKRIKERQISSIVDRIKAVRQRMAPATSQLAADAESLDSYRQQLEDYETLIATLKNLKEMLNRVREFLQYQLRKVENNVKILEEKYESTLGIPELIANAKGALLYGEDRDMYTAAENSILGTYGMAVGAIEDFLQQGTMLENFDVEKGAATMRALDFVNQWESRIKESPLLTQGKQREEDFAFNFFGSVQEAELVEVVPLPSADRKRVEGSRIAGLLD